jgi:hypothetical protein
MLDHNHNLERMDAALKRRGFAWLDALRWRGKFITMTYEPEANMFRFHYKRGKTEDLTFFEMDGDIDIDSLIFGDIMLLVDTYLGYDAAEDAKEKWSKAA